jgi:tetratricopeptide (TPR) repeat protein
MKAVFTLRATLLAVAIAAGLAGCSDKQEEMSQEEIQYLSHLDQSRFFKGQGELKASTREARSAIELQPERPDPYLVILDNLLTAGDAVNAERQLDVLISNIPAESLTQTTKNQASLIRARANLMQGKSGAALAALDSLQAPDRAQQETAAIMRGKALLASGKPEAAREAFQAANNISPSAEAHTGLSKVAWQLEQPERMQEHIAQAQEIDPNSSELWLWKARLAEESGNWPAAEEAYIQALEEIGRYDIMTYRKYETMSALIRALREQGKSSEAFVYEEILAKSAPGTIKSNLTAAQVAYKNGNLEDAARYLEEIRAQAPGNEQAALMLGLVRFRQGRIEEAEQLLTPVAELGESELASKLVAASRLQMRDPEGAQRALKNMDMAQTDPSVLAMVGIASLSTGDIKTGEQLLEKSLSLAPDNQQLRIRYARYLIASDQPGKAMEQIAILREQAGDSDVVNSLAIQAHLSNDNRAQAVALADQRLKDKPEDLTALMTRGELAAQANNYDRASDYFSRAARAHPDNAAPLVALGRLALAQNQQSQARAHFRKAANLSPNSLQALQGMARAYGAEELKPEMEKLAEAHPQAAAPKLILLEIALTNGNQSRADELTAALLQRESADTPPPAASIVANIYNGVGAGLRRNGQADQAGKVLKRGRVLFPENENIALQAASLAFSQNQQDEARRILQEVKRNHSQSPGPYLVEADYFASQQQHQQAAELYELAISKGAGADTKLAVVRSLEQSGRLEDAIQYAQSALGEHPRHQGLLITSAMLHQQNDNRARAIEAYEQVLEINPRNSLALNNLAWLYHQEGNKRASELSRQAYELNPENAAIADTHGWILFKSGQTAASLPILEKAHALDPESREIALHLAEAYRAAGRSADARRILEKQGTDSNG